LHIASGAKRELERGEVNRFIGNFERWDLGGVELVNSLSTGGGDRRGNVKVLRILVERTFVRFRSGAGASRGGEFVIDNKVVFITIVAKVGVVRVLTECFFLDLNRGETSMLFFSGDLVKEVAKGASKGKVVLATNSIEHWL
jgi:hypothetical protein